MKNDKKQPKIAQNNEQLENAQRKERKKGKKAEQKPEELQSSIGRYMNINKK